MLLPDVVVSGQTWETAGGVLPGTFVDPAHSASNFVRRLGEPGATRVRSTRPTDAFVAAHPGRVPAAVVGIVGERHLDLRHTTGADGALVRTSARGGSTVQRFVLPVPENFPGSGEVVWNGILDSARTAELAVWNPAVSRWETLDRARGQDHGPTPLSGGITSEHVTGAMIQVRVLGTDPFADDLPPGPRSRGAGRGVRDPESYDFALVHLTDTQIAVNRATWARDDEERSLWEDVLGSALQWVIDESENRHIVYLAHTGDMIESWYFTPSEPSHVESGRAEFVHASTAFEALDRAGIPYGVLPGNHDNLRGTEHPPALFNEYFGPGRFEAAAQRWRVASYAGPWRPGDNAHHVDLVDAPGAPLVLVHLGYAPPAEALEWARAQFAAHPERDGILLVHDYLNPSSHPDGRRATRTPEGERIFESVVASSPTVRLVLCGHNHGVGYSIERDAGGHPGHHVVEMLADYQSYAVGEETGVTGFLRLLQVDVVRSELSVSTYSPFLDEVDAHPYDPEGRYDVSADNFTVPLALHARTTTLTTGALYLIDRPQT